MLELNTTINGDYNRLQQHQFMLTINFSFILR